MVEERSNKDEEFLRSIPALVTPTPEISILELHVTFSRCCANPQRCR